MTGHTGHVKLYLNHQKNRENIWHFQLEHTFETLARPGWRTSITCTVEHTIFISPSYRARQVTSLTSDKRLSKPGVAGGAPFPKFYHPRKEYLWMWSLSHNILEKHDPTCGSLIHLRSETLHNENRSAQEKESRPVSLVFITPNQYKSSGRICQKQKH